MRELAVAGSQQDVAHLNPTQKQYEAVYQPFHAARRSETEGTRQPLKPAEKKESLALEISITDAKITDPIDGGDVSIGNPMGLQYFVENILLVPSGAMKMCRGSDPLDVVKVYVVMLNKAVRMTV